MCGLAGFVDFRNQPDPALLARMGETIAHRGRDDAGVYVRESVGLCHRRLAILDPGPAGHQPMLDGELAIAFVGEITNFVELRRELESQGATFATRTDTEVVLKAYRAYGLSVMDRLRGFFAFALVDWGTRTLLLARDPAGIKPLYVARHGGLVFASEIKALLVHPAIAARLSPAGLQEYLAFQSYLPGRTLFDGIESLQQGECLRLQLDTQAIERRRYWDLPCADDGDGRSHEQVVGELRETIARAVEQWARADVPIGAHLSGGIDSTLVSALAARHVRPDLQPRLQTFSSLFDSDALEDERLFSDEAARQIGSDHRRVFLDADAMRRDHDDLLYALDMPVAGYSAPYRTMAREVRKNVRVVMTGHGGDELAAGYPRYVALARARQQLDGSPFDERWMRHLAGFEAQADRVLEKSRAGGLFKAALDRTSAFWTFVRPELKADLNARDVFAEAEALVSRWHGDALRQFLALDFYVLLPGLLHVEDRTSMAENLESRPPLLDRSVMECLARVPSRHLLRHGLKSLLRDAARGTIPDAIVDNPRKSGVIYPAMQTFAREMKPQVDADLSALDACGLFTVSCRDMLARYPDGVNGRNLWALWSLSRWIRRFAPAM